MTERPVECSQCKKPSKVIYKEIVGNTINCTQMCSDCPILEQKLHGVPPKSSVAEAPSEAEAHLYCGTCHTSLNEVKMGNPLGCMECYSVFGDVLISQLIEENKIPLHLKKGLNLRKNQPIHIGKSPGKPVIMPSAGQLIALNEALNEAVKKENFEEAAWIRDQIKALKEKKEENGTN